MNVPDCTTPIQRGQLYAGYACQEEVRARASSGGIVSAVLIDLLRRGEICGALVSRIGSAGGRICAVTSLARTAEEVLQHAGSSYIDTPVLEAAQAAGECSGRLAVVALPCQVRALRAWLAGQPRRRERLFPIIGLFCRGNVRPEFYDDYLSGRGIDPAGVETIKVSRGRVKGAVLVAMRDGSQRRLSFAAMNARRQAGVHAKALCAWCDEHLAAGADMAVGDIFLPEYRRRAIKHSAFIARTGRAAEMLEDMRGRGVLTARYVGMARYLKAFAKLERFGNQLGSRWAAARTVGMKAPARRPPGFNVFHWLAWTIVLFNARVSRTAAGRRVLRALPCWLMSAMSYVVKGLSRL